MYIAVVGSGEPDEKNEKIAYELGTLIAKNDWVLICGGLGGIMNAATKGVFESGGTSIGILPGHEKLNASEYLSFALPTGLGEARNVIIARSADVIVAIGGEFGTLSEIAFALKAKKPVIGINTWHLFKDGKENKSIVRVNNPKEAIKAAVKALTE